MEPFEPYEFFESLLQRGINPGLEGIKALLKELGNPQDRLCFIHIAGTNGKGSTAAYISGILTEAGIKNGLFTSPFVTDRRESIQLDSAYIPEPEFKRVGLEIKKAADKLSADGIEVTEFEAMTAAAIKFFADSGCAVAVLEAGMGGRLDATNIIENTAAAVLTSISLDHTDFLGDTVEKIAGEKAGIIKKGCAVVTSASQSEEAYAVIKEKAEKEGAELYTVKPESEDLKFDRVCFSKTNESESEIKLAQAISVSNKYQKENAMLAVMAVKALEGRIGKVSDGAIKAGIEKTFCPARLEVISKKPFILLDGGHNEAAITALKDYLESKLGGKRLLGLVSMMKDKDYKRAAELIGNKFVKIIAAQCANPRAVDSSVLADVFSPYCKTKAIPSPDDALKTAFEELEDYDALIVFGSFYLAAEIRPKLTKEAKVYSDEENLETCLT